ncbi:hypothetical protein RHS01_08185 [Rhizoctonia solani]|uniref:Uncharacterized protein n=1 Tax=Rhizoctonia solani TaxID=456999 RepID=A0A8H7M2J5_9AGAM|nr:hypothetical protein RHS01_08185 [Rhizoctonia solani]
MNQRELYTERIGAIYTHYSTSWNSTAALHPGITLDRAGTTAYKTKLTLDIDSTRTCARVSVRADVG